MTIDYKLWMKETIVDVSCQILLPVFEIKISLPLFSSKDEDDRYC